MAVHLTPRQSNNESTIELCTFYVGGVQFGMDILTVQEINKLMPMTGVPQAPDFVMGILNLRGRIVTIIDLAHKLGMHEAVDKKQKNSRIIIVNSQDEQIGLLVDRIGDVVTANKEEIGQPPANIGGVLGAFFNGVLKTRNSLIGILNVEEVLKEQVV